MAKSKCRSIFACCGRSGAAEPKAKAPVAKEQEEAVRVDAVQSCKQVQFAPEESNVTEDFVVEVDDLEKPTVCPTIHADAFSCITGCTKLIGDWDVVVQPPPPPAPESAPAPPAALPPVPGPSGLLAAPVRSFQAAVAGATGHAVELQRVPLVEGLEAYAAVLNTLGGNMGSYLSSNIQKLHRSKASASLSGYREWLFSELPTHKSTSYKGYADESAWMANLWIGWTLEFFVEFFAQLHAGQDTKRSVDVAYKQTLYNHHNFFQRSAFSVAVGNLPDRTRILEALRGGADACDVLRELDEFVSVGRTVAQFCVRVNEELDTRLQEERRRYLKG